MNLYPLLLKPAVKDNLWGGTRLIEEFGYEGKDIAAEAWVLSCRPDGPAVIQNGELKGNTLSDAVTLWGNAALGKNAATFGSFPLLIKLIDAHDRLSVQVHPGDEYAMRVEGEPGKTEMWYVVDCEPGAQLILGFNRNIDKHEFHSRIENGTLLDVLNFVPVKKGDVFFIEAGTLHAIGSGILIAEVQQNSDTTYRVYDYERRGADGKPRELHIQRAVDVTNTVVTTLQSNRFETHTAVGGTSRLLAECEYFTSSLLTVSGMMEVYNKQSFCSLLCLDGECVLETESTEINLIKGGSVFLPAGLSAQISGNAERPAEILYSYI